MATITNKATGIGYGDLGTDWALNQTRYKAWEYADTSSGGTNFGHWNGAIPTLDTSQTPNKIKSSHDVGPGLAELINEL
jgi:hypothetical protein